MNELSDIELTSFEQYAKANEVESNGDQSQWADYTLRLIAELRRFRADRAEREKDMVVLIKSARRLAKAARSYHNSTGHATPGAAMFRSCDDICSAMIEVEEALKRIALKEE